MQKVGVIIVKVRVRTLMESFRSPGLMVPASGVSKPKN